MNKKLFAASSLLVGAVTLFSSVGCATKNIGKITPEKTTKSFNVATLDIDSSNNTTASVDGNGMMLITTENYNKKGTTLESYTYTLFNVQTNSTVYSFDVDADQDEDEEYSSLLTKKPGFYYSMYTYSDKKSKTEKTEYTLYDKTGVAFSDLEGDFDGNVFVDNSCNRYYLNVNGKIVKESNPLAIILEDGNKVGDYYVQSVGEGEIFTFDEDGKFLRAVDILSELEIPMTANPTTYWSVDNYYFIQYQQLVHDNEKDYDFIMQSSEGLQKYNLVTKRYDMKKGGVKDIDLDFLVQATLGSYNDDSTILGGRKIVDKEVIADRIIQSFDKNGDVLTDLQKLAPGADNIAYASDSALVLDAVDTYYVIQKSKVVATFPSEVRFRDDTAILEKGENLFFYNLDGSQKYSFFNFKSYTSFKDGYIVRFEDSILKYTLATNSVEEICSIDEDYDVSINYSYVYFSDTGAKKGDHNYYSLIPGIESRMGLDDEENDDMNLASIGYYTIEVDDKTTISGNVYALTEQNPKDDEETITTYYNCYETETEAKKGLFK